MGEPRMDSECHLRDIVISMELPASDGVFDDAHPFDDRPLGWFAAHDDASSDGGESLHLVQTLGI